VGGRAGRGWEEVTVRGGGGGGKVDVWFAPAYTAPLWLSIPIVATIHDLSFVAHPEWFRIREGARRRWMVRRTASAAAAVITISQFSRHELIERLGVDGRRIYVVPPGVGTGDVGTWGLRRPGDPARRRRPHGPPAPGPPSVLYVGSVFNRRHVVDLIRALAPIARARKDVSLDLVGDNRSYPRQDLRAAIDAEGLTDRVRWHEYVSDQQLEDLYAAARAFAFLSEYEGLGLTPLEALAAGVPPVLLDTPVARESCGDAALYVPVDDLPAITRALESLLFDERQRAALLAAAPAELAKYNWSRAAHDTIAVLEKAAASRSGSTPGR